jgi:hypothetical protein
VPRAARACQPYGAGDAVLSSQVVVSGTHRIILLAAGGGRSRPVVDALRVGGHDVAEAASLTDASRWLRAHEADLAVIHLNLESAEGRAAIEKVAPLAREAHARGAQLLVLAQGARGTATARPLAEGVPVDHLFGVGEGGPDSVALNVTVCKLVSAQIFGSERYLGPGATWRGWQIMDSDHKDLVVDEIESFARGVGCHPLVAQAVGTAADELISNGLYDAPTDAQGLHRFAHLPREERVVLDPGELVSVRCACDGRRICLSVNDPFGSLRPSRALDNLVRCFGGGQDQIDHKRGGAGVGLYHVFSLMHHLVINVAPGKRTEIIALLEVTRSYREYSTRPRSFDVFVEPLSTQVST